MGEPCDSDSESAYERTSAYGGMGLFILRRFEEVRELKTAQREERRYRSVIDLEK